MDHLLLKAATVATDQGAFTAVISAASIDREKDIVDPAGMVRALAKWVPTGKKIPLAWNHSTAPEHQIGYIDPNSARVQGSEVVADGWIDQSTDAGAHAWRQVKAGTLGFSFGYLALDSSPRKGGGRLLKELDVFEVTASPTPMNNDTRVLDYKAAMGQDAQVRMLNSMHGQAQEFIDSEPDTADVAAMRKIMMALRELGAEEATEPPEDQEDASKSLRAKADAVALELATSGTTLPPAEPPKPTEPERGKSLTDLFTAEEIEAALAKDAKARIANSDFPEDVKDRLAGKAQRILDAQKAVDGTAQAERRAVDPLRAKAEALALEIASGGMSLHKPPQPAKKAPPELIPLDELRERARIEMLTALSGMDIEA